MMNMTHVRILFGHWDCSWGRTVKDVETSMLSLVQMEAACVSAMIARLIPFVMVNGYNALHAFRRNDVMGPIRG